MAQFKWSYSFDGKKLNAKKNVNLNFIFASTANVKPLTANRGLRLGVNKINVNLKVSIIPSCKTGNSLETSSRNILICGCRRIEQIVELSFRVPELSLIILKMASRQLSERFFCMLRT